VLLTTQIVIAEITGGGGLSFTQAARLLPPARKDRPVHPSCVFRWATSGSSAMDGHRVKLESARIVSRLLTSKQALERFVAALSGPISTETMPEMRTPAASTRQHQQAATALAERHRIA
jgi:hypothetical protein